VVVTTTPKPVDILIGTGENGRMLGLLNDPGCAVTRGSSYLNEANLAPTFFTHITRQYQGTRLGRQELEAEILEDLGGLWWSRLFRMRASCGIMSNGRMHDRNSSAGERRRDAYLARVANAYWHRAARRALAIWVADYFWRGDIVSGGDRL
jgi:hypothetical protein